MKKEIWRKCMSKSILIIDDEQNIINALRRALICEDFELQSETDSSKALKLIDENNFDVIICDQKMAGLTGTDILEYCSRISPGTIRILITGYSDINVLADAINKCKIHHYLTKPWDNKNLIDVIKKSLLEKENNENREELVNYIWHNKQHFETIVKNLNSIDNLSLNRKVLKNKEIISHKNSIKISVKKDDSIILLNPSEIYYLTARKGKVFIITQNDSFYSWDSMNSWEQKLKELNFFRCHRSYIVNVDKIKEITPWFNDTYNLKLKDIPDKIYSSKTFTKYLKNRFNIDSKEAT